MNNRSWQFKQDGFDPSIMEKLSYFHPSQLNDPHQRQAWIEFGKKFSEMKLTPEIVDTFDFQQFMSLKTIMAYSLAELSRRTESQKQRISKQEETYAKLKQEQERLNQIHEENQRKGERIKDKLEQMSKINIQEDDSLCADLNL